MKGNERMIDLAKKFDVLHSYFIDGNGVKGIARELNLSKNTAKTYIREFIAQKQEILSGGDKSEILLAMSEEPSYNAQNRTRTVMTDEILDIIKVCLFENDNKIAMGNSKLCMKSTDIHELLMDKKCKISYPTVNNYVKLLSDSKKEAFIKQHYEFGEVCEFDWGDVKLHINNKEILFKLAVFTLACSNIRYAFLYRHEDTQAFIDAHIRFFSFLGRVPHTMVYDNMRVAIAKFVGKNEKIATIALKQMSTYYGFSYRFCNIRKGNEKGHVERSVEYVRRKAFSSISCFDNWDNANLRLLSTIERLNFDKQNLLEQEKEAMLEKMPDYSSVSRENGLVDKFSTISYKQNHYSVPDYLVGKEVGIFIFIDEIVIKYKTNEIAKHKRSYENHTYTLDIMHYRETLMRKPGAIKSSLCLKQTSDALRIVFDKFFVDKPKEFILLLNMMGDYTLYQLKLAIETLAEAGANVQIDNIKMILQNKATEHETSVCDDIEKACEAQLLRYEVVA